MGLFNLFKDNSNTNTKGQLSNEERCGKAWLQIAKGRYRDEGLATMKQLGEEGFDEGYLAYAMFEQNEYVRKDYLKKAADAGNAEAMWQYANYLPHTYAADLGDPDDKAWLSLVTNAANGGCVDAMNELGNIYHRQGDYPRSMYWYAMAFYYGHPDGQISMRGISREWQNAGMPTGYEDGPDFNDDKYECAMIFLEMYASIPFDRSKLDSYFEMISRGTPLGAYFAIGFLENQGMEKTAFDAYDKFLTAKDPHGLKLYADVLLTGKGTGVNKQEAFKMCEKAANAGDRESMYITGLFQGVTNKNLGGYWLGKAYARGYDKAEDKLLQMV